MTRDWHVRVVDRDPSNLDAFNLLGQLYVRDGRLDAAREAFLPITVRCLDAAAPITCVQPRSAVHGVRYEDHPRRAAVGA